LSFRHLVDHPQHDVSLAAFSEIANGRALTNITRSRDLSLSELRYCP
jgi:hypothetical protein